MKISNFIIAMLLVGLVVATISVFYARIATNTGVAYDESDLAVYNQYARLEQQTRTINETLNTIQSDNGILDIIGGLLKSGYGVMKTTYYSVGIFSNMSNQAVQDAHLGSETSHFSGTLILIVLIIVLFTILGVIIGRDV